MSHVIRSANSSESEMAMKSTIIGSQIFRGQMKSEVLRDMDETLWTPEAQLTK